MKKSVAVAIAMLTIVSLAWAQLGTTIFRNETFPKTGNHVDTSATLNLRNYSEVEIATNIMGTDSIKMAVIVDAYIAGRWKLAVATDSISYLEGTGSLNEGFVLRGNGTNLVPGTEIIRVRYSFTGVGVDDSLSALKFDSYLIGRK